VGKGLFASVLPQATVNETTEEEIARRLKILEGVDVLVSCLRPDQCESLMKFVRQTRVSLLICPAKYNYDLDNPRGESEFLDIQGKCCIYIRPFEPMKNTGYLIELELGKMSSLDLPIDIIHWSLNERTWRRTPSRSFQTNQMAVASLVGTEPVEKPRLSGFPDNRSKSEGTLVSQAAKSSAPKQVSGPLDRTSPEKDGQRTDLTLSAVLRKKDLKAAKKRAKEREKELKRGTTKENLSPSSPGDGKKGGWRRFRKKSEKGISKKEGEVLTWGGEK